MLDVWTFQLDWPISIHISCLSNISTSLHDQVFLSAPESKARGPYSPESLWTSDGTNKRPSPWIVGSKTTMFTRKTIKETKILQPPLFTSILLVYIYNITVRSLLLFGSTWTIMTIQTEIDRRPQVLSPSAGQQRTDPQELRRCHSFPGTWRAKWRLCGQGWLVCVYIYTWSVWIFIYVS